MSERLSSAEYEARRIERKQRKADRLRDWAESRERQAVAAFGRADTVRRVNPKSLSIPSVVGGSWTDKLPYDRVASKA